MNSFSIEDLQIPKTIKNKLAEHFASLETLSKASPQEVSERTGISVKVARNAVSEARTLLGIGPMTALELLAEYRSKKYLTTGSISFDEILGGGIPTGSITELAGEFSSGKSQVCFQLCVNAQLSPDYGGLGGKPPQRKRSRRRGRSLLPGKGPSWMTGANGSSSPESTPTGMKSGSMDSSPATGLPRSRSKTGNRILLP